MCMLYPLQKGVSQYEKADLKLFSDCVIGLYIGFTRIDKGRALQKYVLPVSIFLALLPDNLMVGGVRLT